MSVSPARAIALELLARVETQGAWAGDALHQRLGRSNRRGTGKAGVEQCLKREDAALATELVFGVVRWQRLLDFVLERQAQRPMGELDAAVRSTLRLGAYQLLFLSRIPASAAVNESVELAKLARKRSAAGLVNAVLRRLPRGPYRAEEFERSLPGALSPAERLGIACSHPDWLVERWLAAFGFERTRALLAANNRPLPAALAVLEPYAEGEVAESLLKDGLTVERGRLLSRALAVRGGSVMETGEFREGLIVVQDEASQAVALLAGVEPGSSVLDVCAAPGNKTLRLARAAGPGALVVSGDVHLHRLREVRGQLERCGIEGVHLVAHDATRPLPFAGRFDRILVDAPCSGTGTLARNPEIRWRLSPPDLEDLPRRQEAILTQALDVLAPGGRLVYATCSLESEENERVVRRVMAGRADLHLASAPHSFAAQLAPGVSVASLFDDQGFFRTFPSDTATDGFFAGIIERR